MITVAIQGQAGSFHEVAAHAMCGADIAILPCQTFAEVFAAVQDKRADYGVVATENSIHGVIDETKELVESYKPQIVHNHWLPIRLCLIGTPEARLTDITDIYSQYMAFSQCQNYLNQHLPAARQLGYFDTAAAVGLVADSQDDPHIAAIASSAAAGHYGMKVIAEDIQDTKDDRTHFVAFTL